MINLNTVKAALENGCKRVLFASSACIYPEKLQMHPDIAGLLEGEAWRGEPDTPYGVEKLWSEALYLRFCRDTKLSTRIARFHNVYGPYGTWEGGREKAPAALCRKVAQAKLALQSSVDELPIDPGRPAVIGIWGDGEQTRSFLYIDDAIRGLVALMESDFPLPINLGSTEAVTINQLADIIGDIAGVTLDKRHDLTKPQGVRGRNANIDRAWEELDWWPDISLKEGLAKTYAWIEEQVAQQIAERAT
jgi:nucleoside-diphosphate-sugar epimerase